MASVYKAFLSYSHAADGKLAPALQRGLQRLGKPWYRRPIVRVFRDETSLSANPSLWSSIELALGQCEYFLLMASAESARSPWVRREVAWWIEHRSIDHLLIVVTDGEIVWDQAAQDFDWPRTTCLPPELHGRQHEEPLYVDLRWAKNSSDLSLQNLKFRGAVLTLAAPLHGQSMDDLDSEDIRQQRRLKFVAAGASVAVVAMAVAAVWGLLNAKQQARYAGEQAKFAESRSMAAKSLEILEQKGDIDKAILLGVLAWRLSPTEEAVNSLRKIEGASWDVARILGQHSVEQIDAMTFSPAASDAVLLATGGADGSIILWRIPDGTAASSPVASEQSRIHEMRFSGDGLHLLARGYVKLPEEDNRESIIVHDLRSRTNKPVAAEFLKRGNWNTDQNTPLSPDGRLVAFCSTNVIAVWDMNEDRVREKHVSASGFLWGINFIGNTRLAFILATDSYPVRFSAGIWNLDTDTIRVGPSVPGPGADYLNTSAAISSDGSRFVVWGHNGGHIDGFYTILKDLSLQPVPIPGLDSVRNDIRFHFTFDAEGKRVVAGGWGKILVWDLVQQRLLKEVKIASMVADPSAAMSPNGRWLATEEGGKIVAWDLNNLDSKAPGKTIDSACGFSGNRAQECIRRLCEKVSPSIAEKDLSDVLSSSEYKALKQKALAEPCGHS